MITSAHTAGRRATCCPSSSVGRSVTIRIEFVGALLESPRRRVLFRRLELLLLRLELLASSARCSLVGARCLTFCFEVAHAGHVSVFRGQLTALLERALLARSPREVHADG